MPDTVHRPSRGTAPPRSGHRRSVIALFATLGLLAVAGVSSPATAQTEVVDVVHAFEDPRPDRSATELPEGVAVDFRGNVYATLGPPFFVGGGYGAVVKIGVDGSRQTLVEFPEGPAPAGVVVDAFARVYFAVPDPGGPRAGVYRVTRDGGADRIEGTETMAVPNGLALDRRGALFVSDSGRGEIWRISWRTRVGHGEGDVGPWLSHPLLAGCEPNQVGANGIAFHRGDAYVANSERGLLLRVPVLPDGSPGDPIVLAGDGDCEDTDELYGLDGIAIDLHGRVYAAIVLQNRLVRIDPRTGTATPLLDEDDGLWNPASITFGSAGRDRGRLFIANYAVLAPEPPASLGPAVLAYRADVGATRPPPR
jgi:hypothetical protein